MVTNLNAGTKPGRGRPRAFDPEAALAVGQRLFHAAGYDGVGLSALTDALGIKPPSFYMAFGSKAAFFERILERYARTVIPLAAVLQPGRPPGEALADLLERAARTYAQDPECTGCLALEAARGHGANESAVIARRTTAGRRDEIRAFIAVTHPERADVVTDLISTVMSGLSASAREGMGEARLVEVARAAVESVDALLR
ncbi:TetR/AcrR family transcriptional regulator [Paraburkholderia sp.]|uniref:TetR/AcrR family transcriptional regulator n=1 Tax=Paraburkholderia sp. TaxID=1926495 RepID=UPI0023993BEF|nr:TetR/AcrR family transcriptional regulator [Paraburkholderia sp.]MDE1179970.1 TetR/AcrR family transcriptional regulator [Paraburkholderia sp.]